MGQEQNFNSAAYLSANPDVAAAGMDAWHHYTTYGQNEGRQANFDLNTTTSDPSNWQAVQYQDPNYVGGGGWAGEEGPAPPPMITKYVDPNTGNEYSGQNVGSLMSTPAALAELNKYQFQTSGDPSQNQAIYDLKTSNPDLFYSKMADSLSNQMFTNYTGNRSGYNDLLAPILESIKAENPKAYYNAQLGYLGKQEGWQHGQNTFGNAAGQQAEVNRLAPEALAAGLTPEQINALVGGGFSEASTQNQQRIANLQPGNKFWTDAAIGTGKVGLMALGAYGIDQALMAASTGLVDAAGNIIGAGAEGAAYGAGTAATQALPYTEAFDAYNMAQNGYNAATIEQNLVATGLDSFLASDMASLAAQGLSAEQIASTLAASYTPAELAGTGIESLNWGANAAKGLTAADALKYASQAKQALGVGGTLAKLLGGSGTGTGSQKQLASLLGGGSAQTNDFLGQYKMNENPFTFTSQGQTTASPGMYDVSGSNLANALRKK